MTGGRCASGPVSGAWRERPRTVGTGPCHVFPVSGDRNFSQRSSLLQRADLSPAMPDPGTRLFCCLGSTCLGDKVAQVRWRGARQSRRLDELIPSNQSRGWESLCERRLSAQHDRGQFLSARSRSDRHQRPARHHDGTRPKLRRRRTRASMGLDELSAELGSVRASRR